MFKVVDEILIGVYAVAGQEIVWQRQALAILTNLLNRNKSESRLALRIISKCATINEAEKLITQTIAYLEAECQAAETVFALKRGNISLEDLYVFLIGKENKARIGSTHNHHEKNYSRTTRRGEGQSAKEVLGILEGPPYY